MSLSHICYNNTLFCHGSADWLLGDIPLQVGRGRPLHPLQKRTELFALLGVVGLDMGTGSCMAGRGMYCVYCTPCIITCTATGHVIGLTSQMLCYRIFATLTRINAIVLQFVHVGLHSFHLRRILFLYHHRG